jgi:hypothetical protein
MFGKNKTLLLRVFGILQALKSAFKVLSSGNLDMVDLTSQQITTELEKSLEHELNDFDFKSSFFTIEPSIVDQAALIIEYFSQHKFILAGYAMNLHNGLYPALDAYLNNLDGVPEVPETTESTILTDDEKKIRKVIQTVIETNNVGAFRTVMFNRIKADLAKIAFERLQNLKLGQLKVRKVEGNNKTVSGLFFKLCFIYFSLSSLCSCFLLKTLEFIRIKKDELMSNDQLMLNLTKLGHTLQEFDSKGIQTDL